MPPKTRLCSAQGCSTKSAKGGCPMFTFPRVNDRHNRLFQWVQNSGNVGLLKCKPECLHGRRFLCSSHFTHPMFTNKCHVELHRTAIPTVFSAPPLADSLVHTFLSPPLTADPPSNTLSSSLPSTSFDINHPLSSSLPSTSSVSSPIAFSSSLSSSPGKRLHSDELPNFLDLDDFLNPPAPKVLVMEQEQSPDNVPGTPRRSAERGRGSRRRTPNEHKSVKKFKRMSMQQLVGVKDLGNPLVKKTARTAQKYRQMALNVTYKLKISQRRNQTLKNLAKNKFIDEVDELIVSPGAKRILKGELKNFKKKPRTRRWDLEDKLFALAIYKRSPRAYRFLQQYITLPCESTLKNLLRDIPLEVGISKPLMTLLKCNVSKMKASERHCVLLFDEVYLVPSLKYSRRKKIVGGFENYGHRGQTHLVADHALVFMIQGLTRKWTQPVAFFYVHKTCPSSMLRLLVTDVVRAVRETGLNVLATVSDQGPTNRGAVAELKASTDDDIFYTIDGKRMVHIYDVPHIFKNIRNNMLASDIEFEPGKIARWADIIEYFKLDESICSTSHLTYKHLNPQGKEKMKVKPAAQTLGQRPAEAMKTIFTVSNGNKLSTCMDTVTFMLMADKFFDLTNGASSSPSERKKPNRVQVSSKSLHHTEWPLMIKALEKWTYIRKSNGTRHVPPCVKGWIQSIKGIMWIWSQLKSDVKFLNLRHLNQDALENLFGFIRQCCGSSSDMTTEQFKAALKTCLVTKYSGKISGKNCMDDDSYLLNDMRCLLSGKENDTENCGRNVQQSLLRAYNPLPDDVDNRLHAIKIQAPAFICSAIVTDVLGKTSCVECKNALTTMNGDSVHLKYTLSASHYALKKDCKHYPSLQITNSFLKCQEIFKKVWPKTLHSENVVSETISSFDKEINWSFLSCEVHQSEVKEELLSKMCIWLVERKCKMINTDRKKSLLKRTRQTLHAAIKNIDGLLQEEEDLQLATSDFDMLNGLHPQRAQQSKTTVVAKAVFQTPKPAAIIPVGIRTPQRQVSTTVSTPTPLVAKAVFQTPKPAAIIPVGIRTPQRQVSTTVSTPTPLQQTPGGATTPVSARSKVHASWVGASGTSSQNVATNSSSDEVSLHELVKSKQVHCLTVPQLKAILKGKVKISSKTKAQLVADIYSLNL